jgi:[ribosomal protein S5]-alanine N-acetyltransferase
VCSTSVHIVTERFILRPLRVSDVGERYLGWLRDADALKFITAAARTEKLADLTEYVRLRVDREDVLFLGIFEKDSGLHIGNIKYEPLDPVGGEATMGILIGDAGYRGKGVTGEVIKASGEWLKIHRGVRSIMLGVSSDNSAAVRAYEKVGFVALDSSADRVPGARKMVWSP